MGQMAVDKTSQDGEVHFWHFIKMEENGEALSCQNIFMLFKKIIIRLTQAQDFFSLGFT